MIRVFDAFSGIGGFRSALERVGGFKIVAWCEIDKFAQKAYRTLYDTGDEQFYENIRNINAGELADFDLLTGGFPCQPFSVCGARKGFADERGDLFFELARILESKRPRYFLFENVPGLMGIDSGRTFAKIIETLCELGYCVEWRVYNSADYLPQVRKRVYIAGCLGINCSGKILAFGRSDSENSRKTEQIIGGSQGSRVYAPDGLAVTFKEHTRQNGRRIKEPNEPMFTLTVTDRHGIVHNGRIRRLMPIEAWKLQGFTDEQFYKVQAIGMSDAQLYKQAGNAVSVPVVEDIARNLLKFDEEINNGKYD